MERAAVAVEALPSGAPGDRLDGLGIGPDAEREMRRVMAARVLPDKMRPGRAARLQFGACGIDPDPWSSSWRAKKLPGLGGNGTDVPPISSASTPAACFGSRAAIER